MSVVVDGVPVKNELDAMAAIFKLIDEYNFIGSIMSRKDVEDALERPVDEDEWRIISDDFSDHVYRFVMDLPYARA